MSAAVQANPAPEEYCRAIEAYLCRKNDGHLVRIVGPAFEQVCGWAEQGIPLRVAYKGIDQYFERYYAKGPRRRPVRIEFCEPDVLDAFDQWRRAVGVVSGAEASARRPPSMPEHLERTIMALTALRGSGGLDAAIDSAVRELDAARASARSVRGAAREALLERLRALDASLLDAAFAACDAALTEELSGEAERELAPFRDRMPREAYEQARTAAVTRLVRDRFRLPPIAYD